MSDLFGNHIVGFPTRRLKYSSGYVFGTPRMFKNFKLNLLTAVQYFITKTCPCNIHYIFLGCKNEKFHWKKFDIFLIFLLKTYIVGTR